MNRRDFIRLGAFGSVPIMAGWNTALARAFQTQIACSDVHDRIMVVVIMPGGMDSINFLIPISYDTEYYNARPTLGIRNPLYLNGASALNPELGDLKTMYGNGEIAFVDSVGYSNTSGSHFTSMDLVMSGGGHYTFPDKGGVAGRMMESIYPYYPTAFPNGDNKHPIVLQFGSLTTSNMMLNSKSTAMGLTQFDDVSDFHQMISSVGGPLNNLTGSGRYKDNLNYIKKVENASNEYANNLLQAWNSGSNHVTWRETYHQQTFKHPHNVFAGGLKAAARLINGGCDTRLYIIRPTGNLFDTHSQQKGQFGVLSYYLSTAIADFMADLKRGNQEHRVMGLTLSEFGRQVRENSGGGTDHGSYYASTVFGTGVNGGVYGRTMNLFNIENNRVTVKNFDYRMLLAEFARDWLGLDKARMEHSVLQQFITSRIDLVQGSKKAPQGCYSTFGTDDPIVNEGSLDVTVYPNPSNGIFKVKTSGFSRIEEHRVDVFTLDGKKLLTKIYAFEDNLDHELALWQKGVFLLRVTSTGINGRDMTNSVKITVH